MGGRLKKEKYERGAANLAERGKKKRGRGPHIKKKDRYTKGRENSKGGGLKRKVGFHLFHGRVASTRKRSHPDPSRFPCITHGLSIIKERKNEEMRAGDEGREHQTITKATFEKDLSR